MSADLAAETRPQRERVAAAADDLETALNVLASEAKAAARRCGGKRPKPVDLSAVTAAYRAAESASDNHYIALYDLATASGAHA